MQHVPSIAGTPFGRLPASAAPGGDWQCEVVIELVSRRSGIPRKALLHPSRSVAPTARARQMAMYLAHVVLARPMSAVGRAFGRDRTTVSHACARIEDLRDDAALDAELAALEADIEAVIGGAP